MHGTLWRARVWRCLPFEVLCVCNYIYPDAFLHGIVKPVCLHKEQLHSCGSGIRSDSDQVQEEMDAERLPWMIDAPEGMAVALQRCELKMLQAAVDAPLPPELLVPGRKKSSAARIRELEAAIADAHAQQLSSTAAAELQPVDSPAFLALLLAVAHHQVILFRLRMMSHRSFWLQIYPSLTSWYADQVEA
jgi:hypothetical protein